MGFNSGFKGLKNTRKYLCIKSSIPTAVHVLDTSDCSNAGYPEKNIFASLAFCSQVPVFCLKMENDFFFFYKI